MGGLRAGSAGMREGRARAQFGQPASHLAAHPKLVHPLLQPLGALLRRDRLHHLLGALAAVLDRVADAGRRPLLLDVVVPVAVRLDAARPLGVATLLAQRKPGEVVEESVVSKVVVVVEAWRAAHGPMLSAEESSVFAMRTLATTRWLKAPSAESRYEPPRSTRCERRRTREGQRSVNNCSQERARARRTCPDDFANHVAVHSHTFPSML